VRTRLVVVATEQDEGILRCSLRLRAGFVLWPQERQELQAAVEAGLLPPPAARRDRLVAVWGPKGGTGATVLAAHLAGTVAASAPCLLVDLDLRHGDQRVLLGAGDHPRSILDLLEAGDDVSPSAVEGVVWKHPSRFGVVLAPTAPGGRPLPDTWAGVAHALDAIRANGDGRGVVVADLPSGLEPFSLEVAGRADATAIVVTPDLLALRRARDAASAASEGPEVGVILNRWSRSAGVLSPADVEAVLRLPAWATVPVQAGLLRAPDLGRLSRPACRALAPLAARIAEPLARPLGPPLDAPLGSPLGAPVGGPVGGGGARSGGGLHDLAQPGGGRGPGARERAGAPAAATTGGRR
jgi:MinD-like ATPase involved in chromosome partitioning or flagellar assembly